MQEFLTGGGTPASNGSNPSLEELLAFERLLSDLSASFAIVAGDRVVAEIEAALKRLLEFLGFDRSAFWEFIDEERPYFLCSVAVKGVEPPLRGPIPAELSWFASELRARRTSLFDQAKGSRRRQPPRRNIIAALVFAPCLLFRCP